MYNDLLSWGSIFLFFLYLNSLLFGNFRLEIILHFESLLSSRKILNMFSMAESAYKHGPHVEEETPRKYLHKSSKPMAALHKIVLDPKGLNNLHFYIQFQ